MGRVNLGLQQRYQWSHKIVLKPSGGVNQSPEQRCQWPHKMVLNPIATLVHGPKSQVHLITLVSMVTETIVNFLLAIEAVPSGDPGPGEVQEVH